MYDTENSTNNVLSIVMYHYVRDLVNSRYPAIKGLDVDSFKQQIRFLKQHFHIVRMEDVIATVEDGAVLPDNPVLLTFDDGYIDHYTNVLPVLNEEKIQGSFFIPGKTFDAHQLLDVNKIHFILACAADIKGGTGQLFINVLNTMNRYRGREFEFPGNKELLEKYAVANRFDTRETVFIKRILQTVLPEQLRNIISSELFVQYVNVSEEKFARELYMSEDQIKMMKSAGMYIGLHGYDHYWLANLSHQEMTKDIDRALEVMDPFIDRTQWVMNYPYGNSSKDVVDYVRDKGCCLGLSTEVKHIVIDERLRRDSYLKYLLPRLDCNDFPPKSECYKEIRSM